MKTKLFFIFLFLIIFCIFSFIAGWMLKLSAPFYLSAISLVLLAALFLLEILGYEIGGSHITIRKKIDDLEQQNKELKKILTALYKTMLVYEHGNSIWAGVTDDHHQLINEYLKPIEHFIEINIKEQVKNDLEAIIKNTTG